MLWQRRQAIFTQKIKRSLLSIIDLLRRDDGNLWWNVLKRIADHFIKNMML